MASPLPLPFAAEASAAAPQAIPGADAAPTPRAAASAPLLSRAPAPPQLLPPSPPPPGPPAREVSPPAPDLYGASAGKLLELSGQGNTARTSTAVALLRAAQATGDTAAWIQPEGGPLYPPDLAEAGIDLEALVVIHVPRTAGPHGPCRAAELLLRSGAFGFVAIDLCEGAPPGPAAPWQGRLLGLARQHHARLVLLTHKPDTSDSLGPLVGLRLAPRRRRLAHGRYVLELAPLRNKSGTPLPGDGGLHRAPWGLP